MVTLRKAYSSFLVVIQYFDDSTETVILIIKFTKRVEDSVLLTGFNSWQILHLNQWPVTEIETDEWSVVCREEIPFLKF